MECATIQSMFYFKDVDKSWFMWLLNYFYRFKGELFGVGSNHTKYKSKYPVNNAAASSGPPALQFSSTVHYPANLAALPITHSPAPGNFGYEEGY